MGESFPQNFFLSLMRSQIYIIDKDELPLGKERDHSLLYPSLITFVRLIPGHVFPLHDLSGYLLVYSFEVYLYKFGLGKLSFRAVVCYLFPAIQYYF